jgi:hypothetical protein
MPEVLSSLLSTVKPRPQLAKREVESASRFVLDETKFFADIGARANGSFDERDERRSQGNRLSANVVVYGGDGGPSP